MIALGGDALELNLDGIDLLTRPRIPLKTQQQQQQQNTQIHRALNRALIRALYFSTVHPIHCACLRRFKKINRLPSWAETKRHIQFWKFLTSDKVSLYLMFAHRPQCIPKFFVCPPKSRKKKKKNKQMVCAIYLAESGTLLSPSPHPGKISACWRP